MGNTAEHLDYSILSRRCGCFSAIVKCVRWREHVILAAHLSLAILGLYVLVWQDQFKHIMLCCTDGISNEQVL